MSLFGLTIEKLLLIGLLAALLLGPERLPRYAAKLAELIKGLRRMADSAKERMRSEMGPEFDEVDWQRLDPRQYDPRRIIRDAWFDEEEQPARPTVTAVKRVERRSPAIAAPFDSEAT